MPLIALGVDIDGLMHQSTVIGASISTLIGRISPHKSNIEWNGHAMRHVETSKHCIINICAHPNIGYSSGVYS